MDAGTPVDKNGKAIHPHLVEFRAVSKKGGDEWRAMSEAEKQPFVDQAKQGLSNYKEAVEAYQREKA